MNRWTHVISRGGINSKLPYLWFWGFLFGGREVSKKIELRIIKYRYSNKGSIINIKIYSEAYNDLHSNPDYLKINRKY